MKIQNLFHKIKIILKIINITKNSKETLKLIIKNKCPPKIELKNGINFYTNENALDVVAIIENFSSENNYDRYLIKTNENQHIIDIGANIGTFSVYIGKKYPSAKIFCYEPDEKNYDKLLKNIQINSIKNTVTYQKAVGKKNGISTLFSDEYGKFGTVGSSTNKKGPKEKKVESITLQKILEENKIEKCNLLKLDCEGAEYEILMNNEQIFNKIELISLEYHNDNIHNGNELKKFLENIEYQVELIPDKHSNEYGFIHARKIK
ncbi:FkbM family methyltransferase [Candidatus Nitrosopumilus koreensis AR1]|uniref:FkbM family methyltransferase n=1 Tax=Candidatus Nitrosopumilus koreensis AR1 TaxID=1229908 RepID=K0B688_9ARCH|nr:MULTISPECIES: FkbM family methyltransferase [Nitrosopumilus]AFS80001.1 FkbM family methyltransferase [Candidatus Nitrosopumilus koreensis AR1]